MIHTTAATSITECTDLQRQGREELGARPGAVVTPVPAGSPLGLQLRKAVGDGASNHIDVFVIHRSTGDLRQVFFRYVEQKAVTATPEGDHPLPPLGVLRIANDHAALVMEASVLPRLDSGTGGSAAASILLHYWPALPRGKAALDRAAVQKVVRGRPPFLRRQPGRGRFAWWHQDVQQWHAHRPCGQLRRQAVLQQCVGGAEDGNLASSVRRSGGIAVRAGEDFPACPDRLSDRGGVLRGARNNICIQGHPLSAAHWHRQRRSQGPS